MTTVLRVRNWEEFQHYRDRDPVWIKVYGRLLDDADFLALPEAAQAQLVKLWLVASRCRNQIRDDATYLRFALHAKKLYVEPLVSAGFLERVDSKMLAKPLAETEHDASPHARPRARGEGEAESSSSSLPETRFLAAVSEDQRPRWLALFNGWREGMGFPGGQHATDVDIGVGLNEYLADNPQPSLSPRHVKAYVAKAMQARLASEKPSNGPYFSAEEVQHYGA